MTDDAGCNGFYICNRHIYDRIGKDNKMDGKKSKFRARSTGSAERRPFGSPNWIIFGQNSTEGLKNKNKNFIKT